MSSSVSLDSEFPDCPNLIPGYCPYICDGCSQVNSRPFIVPTIENRRTEEEIDRIRHSLKPLLCNTEFSTPIPLADFCLIAKQRWDTEEASDSEVSIHLCELI